MAHHFESGLFFGQNAWHGLGTTLAEDSPVRYSIDDAIKIAGLDWAVQQRPIHVDGATVPSHKAIVRGDSNTVLGIVGNRYQPLQNRDQFNWFRPYLESELCQFETCGALKGGSLVWVLAKINRPDSEVANGDMVKKYLLLTSSHDGSKATSVGFCPIRVVCWNTLSAGLASSQSSLLKVKHTAKQHVALATIRDTINLVDQTFEATAAQYRKLANCRVDADDVRNYVKLVLEVPEGKVSTRTQTTVDQIFELATSGEGNDGKTAWSAYNGVTHYVTHFYGRNADSRLRANWYGAGKDMTSRAFKLALELAA